MADRQVTLVRMVIVDLAQLEAIRAVVKECRAVLLALLKLVAVVAVVLALPTVVRVVVVRIVLDKMAEVPAVEEEEMASFLLRGLILLLMGELQVPLNALVAAVVAVEL